MPPPSQSSQPSFLYITWDLTPRIAFLSDIPYYRRHPYRKHPRHASQLPCTDLPRSVFGLRLLPIPRLSLHPSSIHFPLRNFSYPQQHSSYIRGIRSLGCHRTYRSNDGKNLIESLFVYGRRLYSWYSPGRIANFRYRTVGLLEPEVSLFTRRLAHRRFSPLRRFLPRFAKHLPSTIIAAKLSLTPRSNRVCVRQCSNLEVCRAEPASRRCDTPIN